MSMLSSDIESRWAAGSISQDHARQIWNALPAMGQALAEHGPQLLDFFVPGNALLQRLDSVLTDRPDWMLQLEKQVAHKSMLVQDQQQTRLFEGYVDVLNALSVRHPLILLLDDLQWADDGTLGLLFHLGRRLTTSRILIIGAYRPSDLTLGATSSGESKERPHPLKPWLANLYGNSGKFSSTWEA